MARGRSFAGWRSAFCVKCNADRVATKHGTCIQCGEKLAASPGAGSGGFKAEPTVGPYSGKMRDSKDEARREPLLQALANAGRITDLELKPGSYALEVYSTEAVAALLLYLSIDPAQYEQEWLARLTTAVERSRQHIGGYTPDFQYRDHTGARVVEDVKGWKVSRDFPLRKKLMVACHNVEVKVIREQRGVQQWARGAGAKGKGTGSRLRGARG